MGQKVNPIGFRLGVRRNWSARWYANKHNYSKFLEEDNKIRGFLNKKLRFASVPRVVIERASNRTRVTIWTARPGIVIGRKGQELDTLKDALNRTINKDIRLEIQEINVVFDDYPKPLPLIKYLSQMVRGEDEIFLAFFAGSSSTAHAIVQQNKEDSLQST